MIEEEKKIDIPPASAPSPKEGEAAAEEAVAGTASKKKKRRKKQVTKGRVYIQASYNNTIVSFTDQHGNVLASSSAGNCGFKGAKKSTPYAAGVIVKTAADKVKDMGLKDVEVFMKGIGSGREGAVRALNAQGFNMSSIRDITPIPHNGPRAKKPRRV